MNINQTKDYIRRVDIIKLIISELAELETIYINKKDEPLDERYGINTPMDKILLGRANLGGCLKELVKNDQLQWFKSDYPDLWAKIPEQIKREIDVDSKPTPDAKPEAEKTDSSEIESPATNENIYSTITAKSGVEQKIDSGLNYEDRVARTKVKELAGANRALKKRLALKYDPDPNQLEQLIDKSRHIKTGKFSYRKLGKLIGCTHTTAKSIVKRNGLEHLTV
ncbi:MAG TPA: hypothetical protein PLW05_09000 [Candidatus Marinimicrobia bacterium]|nr:hypothetical protein [Candidatus Neomarinimicrobiota bacterium]HQH56673.1 hypothetical protein [Candidatus Neomarinimicrobiota bacterium]